MTESAGRARLIAELIADAQEAETQAGIFSRRNWGVLNEQGNVEVMPGLLDRLSVRLESIAKGLRAAAEALAGQEEAPQPESGCGRHEGVSIGKPCGECQLERVTELENALEVAQEAAAEWRTRLAELIAAKAEEDAPAPPRWQPISSAPKDKTWFLGWNSDCGVFVWRDGPGLLTGEDPAPTHWMPLPDPPSASGEDQ